jgi:hypothetical protein
MTWIPLLVRSEDYAEFAAMVADREMVRDDEEEPAPPVLEVAIGEGRAKTGSDRYEAVLAAEFAKLLPWELADLERLANSSVLTAQRWALAMDVCTAHEGEFLSTEQVCAESGMSINEWRDAPRKLPRHLASHYPAGLGWPLRGVWGRQLGRENQVYWAITPEQAKRWRQVRGV